MSFTGGSKDPTINAQNSLNLDHDLGKKVVFGTDLSTECLAQP